MKTAAVTVRPGQKVSLSKIDPDDTGGVTKEEAIERFEELREKVSVLQEKIYAGEGRSLLIIFQAMDTGGKDGAIKNFCAGLNPAGLELTRFKVPTPVELDHDFLWRAHKAAPAKGMIGVWNRSHYEDVLVVRVHKLVAKKIWKDRYNQINRFEEILTRNGTTIIKFMLHISKDEQKARLEERVENPRKQWKFNSADLKERAFWDDYEKAYEDAINCCTTRHSPWHIVPANHKWARNLAIAQVVLPILKRMHLRYPKPSFDPAAIVID